MHVAPSVASGTIEDTMTADGTWTIRPLVEADLAEVARIDALHTGLQKPQYWTRVFRTLVTAEDDAVRVGLAAQGPDGLAGYLIGEIRAFEFGSEACGWIFAVGVDEPYLHTRVGSSLVREASARFRAAGVTHVRTMVRRNDVPVLSFFRSNGFAGGAYVQLELELDEDDDLPAAGEPD
jgi:ribosomal protein S18 acetylase RimI-like enzyme